MTNPSPNPAHSGDASPFVMFRGSPFSHLMIPMPGFYDYGAGAAAVAPRMVGEPEAKAAAARGAGPQVSQSLYLVRWASCATRTHKLRPLRSTQLTDLLRTYAGSLVVGTLGVALVAALVVVVKSRLGAIAEPPTAPAPVLV